MRGLNMDTVPTTAWFTVNRSCNFRCKWCYAKDAVFDSRQTLTMELALRLLKITKEVGIKRITLIGGEPTLWKHLLDFNAECRKIGIKSSLVTNGYRFSNDDFWGEYIKTQTIESVSPLKHLTTNQQWSLLG